MVEAPDVWQSILNIQFYTTITEFQNAVKFHEETLIRLTLGATIPTQLPNSGFTLRNPWKRANTHFVGYTTTLKKPEFPKDDKNVSPRCTPELDPAVIAGVECIGIMNAATQDKESERLG